MGIEWIIAAPILIAEAAIWYWVLDRYGEQIIDIILKAMKR